MLVERAFPAVSDFDDRPWSTAFSNPCHKKGGLDNYDCTQDNFEYTPDIEEDNIEIPLAIPSPPEMQMDSADAYHLTWFVYEAPELMGVSLYPTVCATMYCISKLHPILHHTILAFSSHFGNLAMGKQSDINARLPQLLPQIQNALVLDRYDDGHIIAVFLICLIYHTSRDEKASAAHLYGLSAMISHARQRKMQFTRDTTLSSMVEFVARQCIRYFNQSPFSSQKQLCIEPTVSKTDLDVGWVRGMIHEKFFPAVEMTYIFQDFQFAILGLHHRATKLRASKFGGDTEEEFKIGREISYLLEKIQLFQARLAIFARGPVIWPRAPLRPNLDIFPGSKGPVLGLTEPGYGHLLLASFHLTISLSIIADPRLGPVMKQRTHAAIELCRHYAVLQVNVPDCNEIPILTSLLLAGLTLGPMTHPDGMSLGTPAY
jgi:hypothetical protein